MHYPSLISKERWICIPLPQILKYFQQERGGKLKKSILLEKQKKMKDKLTRELIKVETMFEREQAKHEEREKIRLEQAEELEETRHEQEQAKDAELEKTRLEREQVKHEELEEIRLELAQEKEEELWKNKVSAIAG